MSWFDKAKDMVNEGVQEAKSSVQKGLEEAQENRKIAAEEQRIQRQIEKERLRTFKTSAKSDFLEIDIVNKMWRLTSKRNEVYDFSDLVSYELLEDGDILTSGGLGVGRAVVGTIIAGPVGAVLGGLTKKRKTNAYTNSIQIRISNAATKEPTTFITLLNRKTKNRSFAYKKAIEQAQETLSLLDIIADATEKSSETNSSINQLREYKELLDEGIITQEEFEQKNEISLDK